MSKHTIYLTDEAEAALEQLRENDSNFNLSEHFQDSLIGAMDTIIDEEVVLKKLEALDIEKRKLAVTKSTVDEKIEHWNGILDRKKHNPINKEKIYEEKRLEAIIILKRIILKGEEEDEVYRIASVWAKKCNKTAVQLITEANNEFKE